MKRNIEQILFYLIPFCCIALFMSSGEKIFPLLKNTFVEEYLYMLSYPNSIIFNLCIGFLSGMFIYYFSGYIPAKKREKEQNILTSKLFNQINESIRSKLFKLILNCSTVEIENINDVSAELFKEICNNCKVYAPTGYKKIIRHNPYETADLLLNERLMRQWSLILRHLDEIDNASIYIEPKYYDNVYLKIKKCQLLSHINDLSLPMEKDDTLSSWSEDFYELYEITKEIDVIIKSIEAK